MREKRLRSLLDYINHNGLVSISELCDEFSVSEATIRRDIHELAEDHLLKKVHGGVKSILRESETELPYTKRIIMNVDEKVHISKFALSLINESDIIILDSSTTTTELAKLLAETNLNILVITNDTNIAGILTISPTIDIIMIGGVIRKGYYTTLGAYSEEMWRKFHANKLFLGVDAVSPESGIMGFQTEEIMNKQVMIEQSKECIVLADHTKFSSFALSTISPISKIDKIITSTALDDYYIDKFTDDEKAKIIRV